MRRKVSLKQISERCGYSVPLVSSVLSGKSSANRYSKETFDKISKCAREMGYTPNLLAKAVVTGKSPIVLFSLREQEEGIQEIPDFYLNDLILGGSRNLAARGLYVLHMPYKTPEEQLEQIRKLVGSGIIGGIIANILPGEATRPLLNYLEETQIPAVILGFPCEKNNISVGIDNSPIESILEAYTRKHGYQRWLQIYDLHGMPSFFTYPQDRMVTEKEILDPETLLFLPGINRYHHFGTKYPAIQKERGILLEDTRFFSGISVPAILLPSAHPQAISMACDLLVQWCKDGLKPEVKPYIIKRSCDKIKYIIERTLK